MSDIPLAAMRAGAHTAARPRARSCATSSTACTSSSPRPGASTTSWRASKCACTRCGAQPHPLVVPSLRSTHSARARQPAGAPERRCSTCQCHAGIPTTQQFARVQWQAWVFCMVALLAALCLRNDTTDSLWIRRSTAERSTALSGKSPGRTLKIGVVSGLYMMLPYGSTGDPASVCPARR